MEYDAGIDKNNLDEEAIHLSADFDAFSTKEAEWSAQWDDAKDQMKVLQADVALEIRSWTIEKINSFFRYELTKLTEEVYKQLVFSHPKVIELYNDIANIRTNVLLYQAARKSIEQKAARMDMLAKLHGQGYFMKVEGRAYKRIPADNTLELAKKTIIKRLRDEENAKQPPALTGSARKTLKTPKKKPKAGPKRVK